MASRGSQTPTYSWCVPYGRTEGGFAVEYAEAYGLAPHPWQRAVLKDWLAVDGDGRLVNTLCLLCVPRQNGKALALDTEIPTPDGWKAMSEIHVGDYVFGRDGKPSRVVLESEVFHKPMYRVTFDDDATVNASEDHVWTVQTRDSMRTCRRVSKTVARTGLRKHTYHGDGWFELTTREMLADHVRVRSDGRLEYRYRIPMNGAVEYPTADLPIPPYALGAWMGDGTSKNATITVSERDVDETSRLFNECGYPLARLRSKDRAPCFRIGEASKGRYDSGSFYARLKSLGVLRNKHIPDAYMTASVEQRWELLRGLMDTDGYCSKAGQCEFAQKDRKLCEQMLELCSSLGIKARMHERQATRNGVPAGTAYRVTFFTDSNHPCFKLERKRARLKSEIAKRTAYKAVVSIDRIDDAPSKCIAIDDSSHLYLAGRRYTATHNTGACDPRETWGMVHRGEWILHTAQEFQTSQKAFDRLREKFGACKNDKKARYPELNRLVAKYTTSANQMVLDLTNGAHIEFRTRGTGGDVGRGGTFDLIVVDEAQSYTEQHDAALSPLNSAAPSGSSQTILMGTVPDPARPARGKVFRNLRAAAHDAPYEGLCIHEWAAPEIGDVADEARWYEYNPSLGYQLLVSGLRKDARGMSPDTFAQEHLGWWGAAMASANPISAADWDACRIDVEQAQGTDGARVFAVRFDPEGGSGVVAVCILPDDASAPPYVEVCEKVPCSLAHGLARLADFVLDVAPTAEAVVIDGASNADTLEAELLDAGLDEGLLVRPSTGDAISAYTGFVNATRSRAVSHMGQEQLDASAKGCGKRRIGTRGGYGFASNESADATFVEAAALAHWKGLDVRRNPPTEMRMG